MMCQYRFINCNKCTTLVGDDAKEEACRAGIYRKPVPSTQFFHKPKTSLKINPMKKFLKELNKF